jgi:hypothetical protein
VQVIKYTANDTALEPYGDELEEDNEPETRYRRAASSSSLGSMPLDTDHPRHRRAASSSSLGSMPPDTDFDFDAPQDDEDDDAAEDGEDEIEKIEVVRCQIPISPGLLISQAQVKKHKKPSAQQLKYDQEVRRIFAHDVIPTT